MYTIYIYKWQRRYKHKIHHAVVNMNNYSNNKYYLLSFLYINLIYVEYKRDKSVQII